ncbi:hypothetical protein [Haloarcula laminariae]|uniref:hypothetical protein n=1 Tax=Haloarcula laminariae TaxID=2961577 RepID=UPI0021C88D5C|nr:hypothetical protein [Halomicroarcula laminariae]
MEDLDPDQYVNENSDQLAYVIKHSNDRFVRSLCLAALVEYGDDGDVDKVRNELEQFQSVSDS